MAGKVRVSSFTVSADGFGAGPDQSLSAPLGTGGERLHQWFYPTRTFQTLFGEGQGTEGTDNAFAERGLANVGAWILGRNMFGPIRGDWLDEDWKGWWGEEPPYHVPVFVLTHHPRAPLSMKGGTVFHFESGGVEAALERARVVAGDMDIRIGGGAATIRQFLRAGLIDEMHVVISPVMLGRGEPFWEGLDLPTLGYEVVESVAGERATHLRIGRSADSRT